MKEHVWTWPIASYLFLGGLGASMTIITATTDLFFESGLVFSLSLLFSTAVLAFGSFLLIFELGRPMQFWRVFSLQKAVLTFGAWMVFLLMVINIVYFSFWVDWFPWQSWTILRLFIAVLGTVVGCGVLFYTGIELSSMKGRVLWNTPVLPVLFAVSGLLTGVAAVSLLYGLWPSESNQSTSALSQATMITLSSILIVATLAISLVYIVMMYTSSNREARVAAKRWLSGSYSLPFWGGMIFLGLIAPLLLFTFRSELSSIFAFFLVLAGGVFLRFLVVYSDDRRILPGESTYWNLLPTGKESFLKKNW